MERTGQTWGGRERCGEDRRDVGRSGATWGGREIHRGDVRDIVGACWMFFGHMRCFGVRVGTQALNHWNYDHALPSSGLQILDKR